ncbi:hypothetical protein SAT01_16750 [Sinomonas atrocyanea]|nr:hypothetical protein SAT01_16750 [Sinomonas atrocyanea]GGG57399.1 hypothetical protein GCM10007172_05350 [Sinomonas atrocyanea]
MWALRAVDDAVAELGAGGPEGWDGGAAEVQCGPPEALDGFSGELPEREPAEVGPATVAADPPWSLPAVQQPRLRLRGVRLALVGLPAGAERRVDHRAHGADPDTGPGRGPESEGCG